MRHTTLSKIIILCFLCVITGCGGSPSTPFSGGGGGHEDHYDPLKGATLELEIDPTSIKIGDRAAINILISDLHPNGALVKVRFPKALTYENESSILTTDHDSFNIGPAVGPKNAGGLTYIVYLISRDDVSRDNSGQITLTVRANALLEKTDIEVDDDIHTAGADPAEEFRVREPFFSAEDAEGIAVRD